MKSTFEKFTEYIQMYYTKLNVVELDQVLLDVETTTILPAGMNETMQGRHACNLKYNIIFAIDRLEASKITYLFLLVHAFVLSLKDREKYKLSEPSVNMLDLEDNLRYVEFRIEVNDEIFVAPKDEGDIMIGGQSYALCDYSLNVAENANIKGTGRG